MNRNYVRSMLVWLEHSEYVLTPWTKKMANRIANELPMHVQWHFHFTAASLKAYSFIHSTNAGIWVTFLPRKFDFVQKATNGQKKHTAAIQKQTCKKFVRFFLIYKRHSLNQGYFILFTMICYKFVHFNAQQLMPKTRQLLHFFSLCVRLSYC